MSHLYNIRNILQWYISTILICWKRESSFTTLAALNANTSDKVKLEKESSEIKTNKYYFDKKDTWEKWIQWHSIILMILHSTLQNHQATLHKSWLRCSHALNSLRDNVNNSNWKWESLISLMKSKKSWDNDWLRWMCILACNSIS